MRFHTRKWVKPEDLNPNGTLFGGRLLAWIDEEAALYTVIQLENSKIVTFKKDAGVNAFRTALNSLFGAKLRKSLTTSFGKKPVSIRTMGGTVPIIPANNTKVCCS